MHTSHISVTRTARVISSERTDETKILWICLHGYGELATDFYEKVQVLADERTLVVCPEGLSRFYTRGGSGPVGASWMTKEAREDEISDYCRYLNSILDLTLKDCSSISEINILGFSQGAATASRFVASLENYKVDKLILWGAVFPPDMERTAVKEKVRRTYLVAGDNDKYLSSEIIESLKTEFDEFISYNGGHEVIPNVLLNEFRT